MGGILRGAEIAPGFTAPGVAHTVGRLRRSVVEELELARHGLELLTPAVRLFAPQLDGSSVTFWGDVARTAEELRERNPRDARRVRLLRPEGPSGRVVPRLRQRGDAAGHQRADDRGRDLRSPGRVGVPRASARSSAARRSARCRWPLPTSSRRCSKRRRSEGRSRPAGCSSRRAARGRRARRRVFLNDSAGNDGGAAGTAVFARGGTQALAAALASAASAAGAEIRTGVEVTGIRSRDGRVLGVTLADGTEIDAGLVVSAADPKRTLALCDPVELGPTMIWRASNIRQPGATAKVEPRPLRSPGVPRRPRAAARADRHRSLDRLRREGVGRAGSTAISRRSPGSRRRSRRSWIPRSRPRGGT